MSDLPPPYKGPGNNAGYIVGSACIVLFGFMYYKQTMLQSELKRLRSTVESFERKDTLRDMALHQFQTEQQQPQQPQQPPQELMEQQPPAERYVPPPRVVDMTSMVAKQPRRSRASEEIDMPPLVEDEPSFFDRPDPMMADPTSAGELPPDMQEQIARMVAEQKKAREQTR